MLVVRRLLAQRYLAVLLCAATLALKLLVPTGYMIGNDHGRASIELCSGMATQPMAMAMAMTMPGDASDHGTQRDHGKTEVPCAFSGLSAAALSAADPVQLSALIVFVMAISVAPVVPTTIVRRTHLRPPLRAPPTAL